MNSTLITKYIDFVNEISKKHKYDSNIKHLLYLIIPAFISKYTLKNERLILNTFNNTKIITSNKNDKNIEAFYTSIPKYNNNKIETNKYIFIQNYENISLIQLLDNLVHEFNHAINSYNKEIQMQENILTLRTGLTKRIYSIPSLKPIEKEKTYILEEILNTHQTETIINIIKNYQSPELDFINTTIYSINNETNKNYTSKAYELENILFKKILENKTFISTLNNLRLSGDINDIESWFDNITNQKNSYQKLNTYLETNMKLQKKLINKKIFKKITIAKIKINISNTLDIIRLFNKNCNYK